MTPAVSPGTLATLASRDPMWPLVLTLPLNLTRPFNLTWPFDLVSAAEVASRPLQTTVVLVELVVVDGQVVEALPGAGLLSHLDVLRVFVPLFRLPECL